MAWAGASHAAQTVSPFQEFRSWEGFGPETFGVTLPVNVNYHTKKLPGGSVSHTATGLFNATIGRMLTYSAFYQRLAKRVEQLFRWSARQEEGGSRVFANIASNMRHNVSGSYATQNVRLEVYSTHHAAGMKEKGGTITAGKGRYASGQKHRGGVNRSGRAKFLPIPIGHKKKTEEFGRLRYVMYGQTGNFGGILITGTGREVFRLVKSANVPPHKNRRRGGTGWTPTNAEIFARLQQAAIRAQKTGKLG